MEENKKQKLLDRIIDFYLTGHNLKEQEAKEVISLKDEYKAINYSRCCKSDSELLCECKDKDIKHIDNFSDRMVCKCGKRY